MFNRSTYRHSSAFLVFGAIFLVITGLGMAPGAMASGAESENLAKLLKERKALLEQAVQIAEQEYRIGGVDLESMLGLQRDLLNAELELAASREERIKLHEEFVELAKDFEKTVAARFRTGGVAQVDMLKAKAVRLQSQIDLERAKLKAD